MSEHYQNWWHDGTTEIGFTTALDAKPVFQTETPYHRIEVLAHEGLGWVLAIDGVLQDVEHDPACRELRVHVPLLGRARSQCRVLLLGGGDGALLHELLRHSFVKQVVLCEPDAALIDVGSGYLGFGADLNDSRVEVRQLGPEAALAFCREHDAPFDVILPAWPGNRQPSPAGANFDEFCELLADCLTEEGTCVDSDSMVLAKDGARWRRNQASSGDSLLDAARDSVRFARVEQYHTATPLAHGGFVGFFLYARDLHSYAEPKHEFSAVFYNQAIHRAAFALPGFWGEKSHD